ncbi:MAG: amidohydrolase family protein [Planctomycetes bacterium]|nr:amidohydrolase family protein [Planctomycetota bacterium]
MLFMIIDSHTHLFPEKVIARVSRKTRLVRELALDIDGAAGRSGAEALLDACEEAGIDKCLLLPTAAADRVMAVNRKFQKIAETHPRLLVAGKLHPGSKENLSVIEELHERGVHAIKLCTFSQGFGLDDPETEDLFDLIRRFTEQQAFSFTVILDTFFKADLYFSAPKKHLTTPERLGRLVRRFPGVYFIAAHMGGLTAPFNETVEHLPPASNLYLETSNASHTLETFEFIDLLKTHGPDHVLFGTDWPWFHPLDEQARIKKLMDLAGYGPEDQEKVFFKNIAGLLGFVSYPGQPF